MTAVLSVEGVQERLICEDVIVEGEMVLGDAGGIESGGAYADWEYGGGVGLRLGIGVGIGVGLGAYAD